MLHTYKTLGLLAVAVALSGCGSSPGKNTSNTVYDLIKSTPELSSFVAALTPAQVAFLSDASKSLTVFAPNNAAMQASHYAEMNAPFPSGQALENTLNNQVLPQNMSAAQVEAAITQDQWGEVDNILGDSLLVTKDPDTGKLLLYPAIYNESFLDSYPDSGSSIVQSDLKASNGTVHITDGLMIPATVAEATFDNIEGGGDDAAFLTPLRDLKMFDDLKGSGPFTVFMPFDGNFDSLPQTQQDCLLGNKAVLQRVLDYNVLDKSQLLSFDLAKQTSLKTRGGESIMVSKNAAGGILLDGLQIKADDPDGTRWSDWVWRNGVTHFVEGLLIPKSVNLAACTVS